MADRRDVLKLCLAAPLAWQAPPAESMAAPCVDAYVFDRRLAHPSLATPRAQRTYAFDGDVTELWYRTLDPAWRRPGYTVAGLTGTDTLFVLERLAWDRGRRVTARSAVLGAGGVGAVAWVIAPVHPSVRA